MAQSYLDKTGLSTLWGKIKALIPSPADSSNDNPKMDGTVSIGSSGKWARADHVHPSDTSRVSTSTKVNGQSLNGDVTLYASDIAMSSTDTTKVGSAIGNKVDKESGKGLSTNDYTTDEKTKLSGIAAGAEVNQNAFANVKVGSTTIAADTKTDTLTLVASDNITLTPDSNGDKITIKAKDTTYSAATESAAGLMSTDDKKKLNKLAFDTSNKIDSSILPSYIDDVIEAWPRNGQTALTSTWLSATSGGSALTPEAGKIYVLMADSGDYTKNMQFRWATGSPGTYVQLSNSLLSPITTEEINTICV